MVNDHSQDRQTQLTTEDVDPGSLASPGKLGSSHRGPRAGVPEPDGEKAMDVADDDDCV